MPEAKSEVAGPAGPPPTLQRPVTSRAFGAIVVPDRTAGSAGLRPPAVTRSNDRISNSNVPSSRGNTVAVRPEPTAPFHSVQHAFRVLEAVARHPDGIKPA